MKRNIIGISLLVVMGVVGWYAFGYLRQNTEETLAQDSESTSISDADVTEGELQPSFGASEFEPLPLERSPASPIARGPEPSRYDLRSPLASDTALPTGTPPLEVSDARPRYEATPPDAPVDTSINNSFDDNRQTDPYALGSTTAGDRYGQSPPVAPESVYAAPPQATPPAVAPPLDSTSEPAALNDREDSYGYDTLRAQNTQSATDPPDRYPAGDAYNSDAYNSDAYKNDFPTPRNAAARLNRETDRQYAPQSPPPSAFTVAPVSPQEPVYDRDPAYSSDPAYSTAETASSDEGVGRPGGVQLEGAQTPGLTLQKFAPKEIQIGKECTFTIKVRNTGQIAAHGVELHDQIPFGTRLVSTKPSAERGPGGELFWALGSLGIGEEATAEIRLMPTAEGEIGSVATLRFEAQASVRTTSTRPLLALRLTAPHQVMIGEDFTVEIELSNPGSGAATGIMLLENVPAGLSHPAGEALEFEIAKLEPGESRQLELVLTAEAAGQIVNTLIARGDANLNIQENVELEVIAPELEVGLTGPKKRYLDRQATYTVSVNNPGTAAAEDVELVTRLPRGMKFIKANNSGQYDAVTHSVYWSLAKLPPKQQGTVELIAVPVEPGNLTLHVEGKADQGLRHEATQSVLVQGISAIMFEVVDIADPIEVGGETTYEIRVVNQGSMAASGVRVAASIPPGMTAVSAGGPTKHTIQGGRVVFEPLRRLAPKADTTYRIKVQGDQPGDQRVSVQVLTNELKVPVTKEESTHVYTDDE